MKRYLRILKYKRMMGWAVALATLGTVSYAADQAAEKSGKTKALEMGAKFLQKNAPPGQLDIYLVGFHPMKEQPQHQMEAHHFCKQVNEDFAQCALFDGNSKTASLNGIEYIVSEKLFLELPEQERKFWHPHNYEILSGQLVAPGLPAAAEKELMKGKMNSYGKTWHVWNTGHSGEKDRTKVPLGEPKLAWSFNHDGEAKPGLVVGLEEKLGVKISDKREERQDFVSIAKPQMGVNAIVKQFPKAKPIPGVRELSEGKIAE